MSKWLGSFKNTIRGNGKKQSLIKICENETVTEFNGKVSSVAYDIVEAYIGKSD